MAQDRLRYPALLLPALLVSAFHAGAQTVPEANPARPTVSTPATLTPVGYLQFETGALGAVTSPEFKTRIGINQVTKLTVLPWLEFMVLTEPHVHSTGEETGNRPGEVFAGVQALLLQAKGSRPAVAVSYIRRLYESPAPELDLGTFRESGTLLFSNDIGKFHYDANFIIAKQTEHGTRRAQINQTLAVSHPVGKFTVSGEFWHFTQPFFNSNAIGTLFSVAYPVRKNLVIDAGFDHGWTGTSTHWEEFVGFTYLLPKRLWGK